MPFPNVTKYGVERNFEQVINSVVERIRPLLKIEDLVADKDGWTLSDDLAALSFMVGQSSDRLWTAAITEDGKSRAGLLEDRVKALELIVSRQDEQLSSLQIVGEKK